MHDCNHTDECTVLALELSCTINLMSSCIINVCEWTEAHVQRGTSIRNYGTESLLSKVQGVVSMRVDLLVYTSTYLSIYYPCT